MGIFGKKNPKDELEDALARAKGSEAPRGFAPPPPQAGSSNEDDNGKIATHRPPQRSPALPPTSSSKAQPGTEPLSPPSPPPLARAPLPPPLPRPHGPEKTGEMPPLDERQPSSLALDSRESRTADLEQGRREGHRQAHPRGDLAPAAGEKRFSLDAPAESLELPKIPAFRPGLARSADQDRYFGGPGWQEMRETISTAEFDGDAVVTSPHREATTASRAGYSLHDAILLMQKIPGGQQEIVVQTVIATLQSAGVDVAALIDDAGHEIKSLSVAGELIESAISELEQEVLAKRQALAENRQTLGQLTLLCERFTKAIGTNATFLSQETEVDEYQGHNPSEGAEPELTIPLSFDVGSPNNPPENGESEPFAGDDWQFLKSDR